MENLLKGINVYLIGMMGVGKTTIGHLLAQHLKYRFFDTDILLEKVAGQSITEIFAQKGEESFRSLESKVLGELSACVKSVISTGGGIVLRRENWGYLQQGLVVWLDAPIEVLADRLSNDKQRPLLQGTDAITKISSLWEQRRSLYAQADLRISIEKEQTPGDVLRELLEKMPTVLKSYPVLPLN